ncbi:peroxiredoxin 4 [Phyllostomus discolor]|uniref:Peroxiredoxin 4 n=1 Tax=Phyllostomus discolor TaxID=89673 RepID=A0A833Z781_9CHIR|nr:peroxiredoxin 4 [Phyllostomus discolor]
MDHRNRQRSIGLSRIPGTQSRTTSAPLALHVEQEARGQDSEQREIPRQRTATYAPLESEELADNVMVLTCHHSKWLPDGVIVRRPVTCNGGRTAHL